MKHVIKQLMLVISLVLVLIQPVFAKEMWCGGGALKLKKVKNKIHITTPNTTMVRPLMDTNGEEPYAEYVVGYDDAEGYGHLLFVRFYDKTLIHKVVKSSEVLTDNKFDCS